MVFSSLLALYALVSAAWADCSVTYKVTCSDCVPGQKWYGEIQTYQWGTTEEDKTRRYTMTFKGEMESGDSLTSGRVPQTRRFLVINGADVDFLTCEDEKDMSKTLEIDQGMLGTRTLQLVGWPPSQGAPAPASSLPVPAEQPVAEDEEEVVGDTVEVEEDGEAEDETSVELPSDLSPAPLPEPALEPTPPARVVVEEEDEGPVVAHPAGWGTPGSPALWLGNDGDYPSAPLASRRGHFTGSERHCSAGEIPLIQGTAAQIAGGIPRQVALDDRRATDVAPPDWNGEYVGPTGTTITGKDAAGIFCVEPSSIIRREPAAMAAVIQPAQPPGVTPEALQKALEDQEKKLREELKSEEGSEPPATATSVPTPKAPLFTRGGPFTGVQWSVGQPNFHWLFGGFVTLRLSDRIWFEPWVAAGTDGKSTHPSGWDEERSVYTETTGTYLAISGGVSFPVVVWEGSQGLTLLLTPSFGWVGDDLTAGVTTWGDMFSAGAQAELWWGREVPFAIYAEASVGVNVWSNDQTQHQWAASVPVKAGIKVPF